MFHYIEIIDSLEPDTHLLKTETGPDTQILHLLSGNEMRKHFSMLDLLISFSRGPHSSQIILLTLYEEQYFL